MTEQTELTRWNRAGLSRFRYIDGNAVTYLEELRLALLHRFIALDESQKERFSWWQDLWRNVPEGGPTWTKLKDKLDAFKDKDVLEWEDLWLDFRPGGETVTDHNNRIRQQYVGEHRRDYAWEIVRSFARACQVLTEHIDAYANEGFLETATQWENLRRLVSMLDYHPAPPASAATVLILEPKEDARGLVERGFQVQYMPPQGGEPIVFETLADIEIDASLEKLHLAYWNVSQKTFNPCETKCSTTDWTVPEGIELSVGDVVMVVDKKQDSQGATSDAYGATNIIQIEYETKSLCINSFPGFNDSKNLWEKASTRLLAGPKRILKPRLNGTEVLSLDRIHNLSMGEVVAWIDDGSWQLSVVKEVDEARLRLHGDFPSGGTSLFKALMVQRALYNEDKPQDSEIRVPLDIKAAAYKGKDDGEVKPLILSQDFSVHPTHLKLKTHDDVDEIFILVAQPFAVGTVSSVGQDEYRFDGNPGDLKSGDWVVGDGDADPASRVLYPLQITGIKTEEDSFVIELKTLQNRPGVLHRLYGPFEYTLRPEGHDRNMNLAPTNNLPLDVSVENGLPELLKPGRTILIEQEANGGYTKTVQDVISAIDTENKTIVLEKGLSGQDDFTVFNTVIRGNVVTAGHGETLGERLLGSGDATRSNQSFVFEVEDVSFVSDPVQPAGVRADIEVKVEGQIWQQVGSLKDTGPTDPHYTVRMTEKGFLKITFGDGIHGRRLPTGINNIRVFHRVGTGLRGNLPAGCLEEPVNPHPFVGTVRQPHGAIGGADREGLDSLREHAPASLLALERAVSLRDFADLAVSRASIWQARAFPGTTELGRRESIEVVIVPAGGIEPDTDGLPAEFVSAQENFLAAHALPGVSVTVSCYTPVIFQLDITVRVKTQEYDLYEVSEAVRASLFKAFALQRRKLGQPLNRSEVYQVVESVRGVENSECKITGIVKPPAAGEVAYLHPRDSSVTITHKVYTS